MKTSKPLTELTLDELNARQKSLKNIAIALGTIMLLACGILIYLSIESKKPGLLAAGIGFPMTFLPILIVLGQVRSEIKKRVSK
ncbi:hypothetical protein [Pedobacter metabolipauper]|uniref:Uncharacterized protein n=1 Tax=Pedobacter metabolipauper TaxID=425513 RepID=A0A4R6ST17_9SPHI|nr:hypothetical protein [Pedobacter metabolipauper]TDQ08457.1 hypothetical protein ATK78_2971 [Pedobacter metabolipauper]